LIRPAQHDVSAVSNWEFCHPGPPIEDLAWAEWIVRRHHRYKFGFLPELFADYGCEP
jgi:aminoglycoside phosphotransferase (APT) family kinase protein